METPSSISAELQLPDVQNVFQASWSVWKGALLLIVVCLALAFMEAGWKSIAPALKTGGLMPVGLFAFAGLSAGVAWQAWREGGLR